MSRSIAANLASFGVFLLIFAFVRGPLFFWSEQTLNIIPAGSWLAVVGMGLIAIGLLIYRGVSLSLFSSFSAYSFALLCLLLSDVPNRAYSFFQGPSIRGEVLVLMILSYLLFQFRLRRVLELFLVVAVTTIIFSFLKESGGQIIFSDDHPSMFYRLSLLKEMLPRIPFYNPQWNAGVEARDFFSTGILNFYLLYLPVIQLFDLESTYNLLMIFMVTAGLALSAYCGSRVLGFKREAGLISALLVLGTCLSWYRWILKYGTMGFATSTVLSIFVFCFLCRYGLSKSERPGKFMLAAAILLTCLTLTWTPIWFIFVPLGLGIFFNLPTLLSQRWFRFYSSIVIVLTVPWLIIWIKVANVLSFVTDSAAPSSSSISSENKDDDGTPDKSDRRKFGGRARDLSVKNVLKELRNFSVGLNPLLLVFAIPGLLTINSRGTRRIFIATTCWLFLLGSILSLLKPHLELERLLVVMSVLFTVPVGNYLAETFSSFSGAGSRWCAKIAALPVMACLLLTPAVTSAVVRNRSLEQFTFKTTLYDDLAKLIRQHGGDGRVVFSGFVLHELGGGHIAPLALEVEHPLVAISFVHDHWNYEAVVPRAYLNGGPPAVEQFFDYMNTTAVFAHERFWRRYFEERPEKYQYAGEAGKFKMYLRNGGRGSYLLEGEAVIVAQDLNRIVINPITKDLILKFKYIDGLEASGCRLEAYPLPGELQLIKLSDCEVGNPVTIRRRAAW